MGGKTGTTTSTTSIPPEVLARYNSVNASAEKTAATPFKEYSSDPNAFVAPLNQQQNVGINNINAYANAAQPGYQAGMNTTGSAINQINAGQNVAQPYFQGAQTMAAGTIPQYQKAAGLAGAAMTPLQQATYAAQPGYQAAQAGTMAAGAGTGQTIGQLGNISQGYNAPNYQAGVAGYMNPFLQNAMGSTAAMMQNQNQQQQNQLQGNAISSGAFGGDRGNIAQAALMGQQNLAMGQTLGQMANTGYQSAAQNYMSGLGAQAGLAGQQGAMYGQMGNLANQYGQLGGQAQQALINAGQAQQAGAANIANIAGQGMNAAGQYGALGTAAQNAALQGVPLSLAAGAQQGALGAGAQAAGLQGAQAQLGAGTLGQQTSQAGKTALYNQFQQQQAYPFQVAQFLANIAEGTGALSGSSTTGTSPMPFFSDRRLKEDIKRVGTADNGLPIYKFKYKGDHSEQTHVGFMADEVEKVHPEAVGLAGGYKTVDYEKASEPVRHHNAFGGLNTNPASTLSGAGAGAGSEQTNQDPSILFPIEHGGTAGDHPSGFGVNHNYSPSTGEGGLMGNIGHSIGNMTGAITGDVGVGGKEGQAMYAHGGLVPSSMGGHVGTEHTGEGYADGGYADYYDPNSIQNIIARHQVMYSNIDSHHVPTYRNLSGGLGKYSRVPEANLPVASLRTSGSLPAMPDSSLKQGLGAVSEAGDFATKGRDFYDWIKKQHMFDSQSSTPSAGETVNALAGQNPSVSGNARGGLVGYASGGDIPYEDTSNDGKLDIPNEKNKHALMTAKNPTGSTSQTGLGLGQALALPGEIAKLGSTASGLASGIGTAATGIGDALSALPFLFLSGGGTVGREHHDGSEGNVVGDKTPVADPADTFVNSYWDKHVKQESGGRQFNADGTPLTSPKGAVGVGQIMPTTGPEAAKLAGVDWSADRLANDPEYNQTLGKAYLKAQYQKYQNPVLATAAYNAGPGNVDSALAKAATRGGSYLDYLPTETQKYVSSIHGDQKQSPKEDNNPLAGLGKMFGIGSAQAQEQPKSKEGGLLPQTGLFSEQTVIPLLTGLGAMASSNSPYLGSALLQGIGAGAQSYLTTQQKQAAIAQTKQETDAIKAEMAKGAFVPGKYGYMQWVKGPNGTAYLMPMAEYQELRRAGRAPELAFQSGTESATGTQPYQAPPSGAAAPAPVVEPTAVGGTQHPLYDATSHIEAQKEKNKFDPTVGGPAYDTNYKLSEKYIGDVSREADAARANGRNVQELSSNLASAVTLKGGATPGPTFDARAYALGLANVAARAAGLPEVSSADSTEAIASKVNAIQSFMQAHGADQNSLGALRAATSTVPNPNMPPDAFAPLSAMLMVQQKRAIDAKNHADNWSQDSGGTYLGASKDFSRKTSQVYADDQNALAALMLKTPKVFQQFMSGRDSQGQPIDESRMTNVLKAAGYNPRVAKYFVLGE